MSISEFDSDRPPLQPRKARFAGGGRRRRKPAGQVGADGSREMALVDDVQFDSYYGRQVVKAPPWRGPIAVYLFLGGLAGGSSLLAFGGQLTNRPALRRNGRLLALGAVGVGTLSLIEDLGRPERFLNMMRTVKISSPMSLGTWILASFGTVSGVLGAVEVDRLTGEKVPLGALRPLLKGMEGPASIGQVALGPGLAAYTGALLGDTAVPTWSAGRHHMSYLFASSASLASGGAAMITSPVDQARPARVLAAAGVVGDVLSMRAMKESMHPLEAEPLEEGKPGQMLEWAERLAIGGGVLAVLGGRSRALSVIGGAALVAASALTRFGVLEAGLESVKDPRRVIEPQKARLAARRAAGINDDSITTSL